MTSRSVPSNRATHGKERSWLRHDFFIAVVAALLAGAIVTSGSLLASNHLEDERTDHDRQLADRTEQEAQRIAEENGWRQLIRSGTHYPGEVLSGLDLSGLYASEIDLSGSDAEKTSFAAATLNDALFDASNMPGVRFTDATLADASFINAELANADFAGAYLHFASFRYADLVDADFLRANLGSCESFVGHAAFAHGVGV